MTPADDLAPIGTEDYYIARLHAPAERLRVALHLALEARLLGLLTDTSDPATLRLKLCWWQDCLAAACADEFHHPLLARLGELDAGRPAHWRRAFADAAVALEERLAWQRPLAAEQILDHLRRVEGTLAHALARDLAPQAAADACGDIAELAALTSWARGLQWLPHWQRLQIGWLPREALEAHVADRGIGVAGATASTVEHDPEHWPRLAEAFIGPVLERALAAHRRLPRSLRAVTLAVRIRHACGRAELARAAAAGWPVLRERATLTPIVRLLLALGVRHFDHLPRGPAARQRNRAP